MNHRQPLRHPNSSSKKYPIKRQRLALCALSLAALLPGCGVESTTKMDAPKSAGTSSAAAAAQSKPDPEAVVAALKSAGAEATKNAAGNITQLTFREPALTDEVAAQLVQLPALQSLVVNASTMSINGWQSIGKTPQLRQLDLRDCQLDNDQFIAAVSGLKELTAVRLTGKNGNTTVDDKGVAALAACPNLKLLAADFLWVGDEGLAKLSELKNLRELYLASSLVDDAALDRIGKMPSVKKLRISKTGVGKEGLAKLTGLQLEELDVSECSTLDDAALEPIGKITSLKKLNLWRDAIGDSGVVYLAGLVNLEWLNVDNTQITDAALKSFKDFKKVTFLHLGSTAVSDAGMPDLLPLKSLKELKVTRTSVTEPGVEQLRQAFPKLDIQLKYGEETP